MMAETERKEIIKRLKKIAKHLNSGWRTKFKMLADTDIHWRISKDVEIKRLIKEMRKAFQAKTAKEGICKPIVFINKQWTLKLGENAVDEAELYKKMKDYGLQKYCVPTVRVGQTGCLQLTVEPLDLAYSANREEVEEFWKDNKKWRNQFEQMAFEDIHIGNVGTYNGELYCFDFGSPATLYDY